MVTYSDLLKEHGFGPEDIWNFDETMLKPTSKRLKVFTRRGSPRPVVADSKHMYEHITLGLCISASGHYAPTLVIFPLKCSPELPEEVLEFFAVGGQANGWIDSAILCNMIENIFAPFVKERNQTRGKPLAKTLLILDGHSTRAELDTKKLRDQYNIWVLLLPAHTSAILQPLDLTVNGEFKIDLKKRFKIQKDEPRPETRQRLLLATRESLEKVLNPTTIKTGFRRSGLWPLNPSKPASHGSVVAEIAPTTPTPPEKKKKRPFLEGGKLLWNQHLITSPVESRPVKTIKLSKKVDSQTGRTVFSVIKDN